jgi:hypothetical protein
VKSIGFKKLGIFFPWNNLGANILGENFFIGSQYIFSLIQNKKLSGQFSVKTKTNRDES